MEKKTQDAVNERGDDASNKVAANVGNVKKGLETESIKLEPSADGKAATGSALEGVSVLDDGTNILTEELVRRHGMFRGLTLLANVGSTNLQTAVQFKSDILALGEHELKMRMQLFPEVKSTVGVVESTSSTAIATTNKMIDTYGTSAFESSSFSAGLGASAQVASVGLSFGMSDESGSAQQQEKERVEQLSEKAQTYSMSKYYFEPRIQLIVDPHNFERTPEFDKAVQKLKGDSYTPADLFSDYGTHLCTRVQLGGYWRITADYKSTQKGSVMSMSKSSADAISDASSMSLGVKADVPVGGAASVSAEVGYSESNEEKQDGSQGKTQSEINDDAAKMMNIQQEWKGGVSGGTEADWRKSLREGANSNWRVIDRDISTCTGIWRQIDDQELKEEVCNAWKTKFLESAGFDLEEFSDQGDCSGNANMQDFRSSVNELKERNQVKNEADMAVECQKQDGKHAEGLLCVENKCTCGEKQGTVGVDCPVHGEYVCSADQKAMCSSIGDLCSAGTWLRPDNKQVSCEGHKCDPSECCIDLAWGTQFLLDIHSKVGTKNIVEVQLIAEPLEVDENGNVVPAYRSPGCGGWTSATGQGEWMRVQDGGDEGHNKELHDSKMRFEITTGFTKDPEKNCPYKITRICIAQYWGCAFGDNWEPDKIVVYNAQVDRTGGTLGTATFSADLELSKSDHEGAVRPSPESLVPNHKQCQDIIPFAY